MSLAIWKKEYAGVRTVGCSGMTVIELTVVVSIFAIISTVVLAKFSDFSSNISLQNLAQDIALHVKQAQYSAISGVYPKLRSNQSVLVGWKPSYGLYFKKTEKDFTYFFDSDSHIPGSSGENNYNDVFSSPNTCGAECIDVISITSGEIIKDIFIGAMSNRGTPGQPLQVALTFTRPAPDMTATNNRGNSSSGILQPFGDTVHIVIGNPTSSKERIISITPLGQVSVQ